MELTTASDLTQYPDIWRTTTEYPSLDEMVQAIYTSNNIIPNQSTNKTMQITNQEWIINQNKDILKKYGEPDINFIYADENIEDKPESYQDWGINILTLNQNIIRPYSVRCLLNEGNQSMFDIVGTPEVLIRKLKVKIPKGRAEYSYQGLVRTYRLATRFSFTEPADKEFQIIRLSRVIEEAGADRTTEMPVAYQLKNTIWLLWDLSERTTTNKAILRYIFTAALDNIAEARWPRKRPADWQEKMLTKTLEEFNGQRTVTLKQTIAQAETDQSRAYKDYVRKSKEIGSLRVEYAHKEADRVETKTQMAKAMEYFKKHIKVESWTPSATGISFIIKDISMEYKGETLALPKYNATLNIQNGDFDVKPADPKLKLSPIHPHISSDGSACLGNFTTIFPKIIATGRFHQILEIIIQYLENYNPDSPIIGWSLFRYIVKHNMSQHNVSPKQKQTARRQWADYLAKTKQEGHGSDERDM